MNHSCILFIILFHSQYVLSEISDFILSPPKLKTGYTLGEKVILTCVVKLENNYSVIFSHNSKYVVENGLSNFHEYTCDEQSFEDRKNYIVVIEKLAWNDGGDWACIQGKKLLTRKIEIKVSGKVMPLKAVMLSSGTSQGMLDLSEILYGKGIRTNPFDLTTGGSISIICSTGCSSPLSYHEWSYRNISIHSIALHNKNQTTKCNFQPDGYGIATESNVTVSCAAFNMVGSNEVTCAMSGSSDSKSVFVLCPGGHKPWTLTNGEIIGISIAVGLAALMVVMFFMSAKRVINSYRYGSVSQGIRV